METTNSAVEYLSPKEYLQREEKKILQNITKLQIEIGVLERSDPNIVVARREVGKVGNTKSTVEVTAKELLKEWRDELAGYELRLQVVRNIKVYK